MKESKHYIGNINRNDNLFYYIILFILFLSDLV